MSAVNTTGAPEPQWVNRPSRNQDFQRPLRLVARHRHPIRSSTCLPDGSRSAQHTHRRPIYVSFVSKSILWDRGLYHQTTHVHPTHRPSLCPRFLSHMKARPEDFRPPCFPSSKSGPWPPSQQKIQNTHILAAPKTHTLEGFVQFNPDRRQCGVQKGLIAGRRCAAFVPCHPLPATPPSSTVNSPPSSTVNSPPPHQNTLHPDSGGQQSRPCTVGASSYSPHPASEETHEFQKEERAPPLDVLSITQSTEPGSKLDLRPSGTGDSESLSSTVSYRSLSDLSRPCSSLFSRSTDLASGRSSSLPDIDSDAESSACFSPLSPSPVMELAQASPASGSNPHQSTTKTTNPLFLKPLCGQTKPLSPRPPSSIPPHSDKPMSSNESTKAAENDHQDSSIDPGLNPPPDSDHGLVTLTFPSTTWSSCPSSQRTTPRSRSGVKLTRSLVSRLESHRWPVLPPISPVRGHSGTAASHSSELSCSQSHVFDELEAIAPRSASGLSLNQASDSSACSLPDTELSPGLAALTVGCDSGNLGSLSRVQLLLLDRPEPETLLSAYGLEEEFTLVQDWSDLRVQYDPGLTSSGVLRPLTAGSISERCDSAGKVQENNSDRSEGGSWSPSSWIIDPSPSCNMFRASCSPCPSSHSSRTDEGGSSEDESSHPGWGDQDESLAGGRKPEILEHRNEEKDTRMEERKTKVLHMLSKLQEDTPRKSNSYKRCSNFEDFDFLAKYCIFSQEKLAEYKRAFEAEDSDGDGYISCLQVLLALKNIIPPELLSDEEEIYVYRILEMVDFRVTDGLVDLRLFAVTASLAQKIATMDEFMRSLITNMDFRSLEVRLFKAKEQQGDAGAQQGFISAEQLLLELKAGGIHLEQEAAIRLELQHIPPLDLLDFLAYLPLFMLIHKSVISNPLDDSCNL
ncbi:uncharacterized protein LOC113142419 isoform X2 [Mastacembelus armatus]|uniref:uncharacterized protein LOC113142419 isoform X2 n=1 Tax=Mastacembelus armatus TaxID=205130 RepID=UPI000E454F63|nr:uncharacterized protein LOC113142419 isoform X2 [Mastacembelus armatus]